MPPALDYDPGCRCTAGWGKHHAIAIFRIKWVWIWLRLSDTRVSSRGAFFVRIDDPRSQKKNSSSLYIFFFDIWSAMNCRLRTHHHSFQSSPFHVFLSSTIYSIKYRVSVLYTISKMRNMSIYLARLSLLLLSTGSVFTLTTHPMPPVVRLCFHPLPYKTYIYNDNSNNNNIPPVEI